MHFVIKSRMNKVTKIQKINKKRFISKQVARKFFESLEIKAQQLSECIIKIFNSFVKIRVIPRELFFYIKATLGQFPFLSFFSATPTFSTHPFYPRRIFNIHFQSDW